MSPEVKRRARELVAGLVVEAILQGDDWTWKRDGVEDPALTEALRALARSIAPRRRKRLPALFSGVTEKKS